jgi:hypothetical protein
MNRLRTVAPAIIAALIVIGGAWGSARVALWLWTKFQSLDPTLSAGILAAATTVFVSTLTVVLGRYYERKKEIEAAYRQKKLEIYDEFLREFFRIFYDPERIQQGQQGGDQTVIDFLREWQRRIILWGGQNVLRAYVDWMGKLKSGRADAQVMFKTEDLFRAIRADLGQGNWKLPKGTFVRFILRNPDLFLAASQKNPQITLAELVVAHEEAAFFGRQPRRAEARRT